MVVTLTTGSLFSGTAVTGSALLLHCLLIEFIAYLLVKQKVNTIFYLVSH